MARSIGMRFCFLLCLLLPLASCGKKPSAPAPNPVNPSDSSPPPMDDRASQTDVTYMSGPYRAELGKPFVTVISAGRYFSDPHQTKVHIRMDTNDSITYKPAEFDLAPLQYQLVTTLVKSSKSGLAVLQAYPGNQESTSIVVDVGFQGHLKITSLPLGYKEPQVLHVVVVDNNDKPLPMDTSLSMQIQSADALLHKPGADSAESDKYLPLHLTVPLGATSSTPFTVESLTRKGGQVHLLATLSLREDSGVISQNIFSLDSDPVWWLPIVLAIGGAMLYAIYHAVQDEELNRRWLTVIPLKLLVSIFAGVVAYLFADYDLLGLKLDPHVLRTYPLLGFLFSFVGIDALLSKRFGSNTSNTTQTPPRANPTTPPADPKVTPGEPPQ